MGVLLIVVSVFAGVMAAVTLLYVVRDEFLSWPALWGLAALEVALIAVAVAEIAALLTSGRHIASGGFMAYLLGVLVLVPAGTGWAIFDRSRWGVAAIVIACLAVPVMLLRVHNIWEAGVA
ncbi:MAG: hypothetical protein QM774_09540 [Gordonia sp. (in: high G+C Gram-positive bacteria)]|uniref:hypothetical protein n=1 Tax=Gordonia sp. (in: high G+C Gram-positive bacteria) TaxID=84139 RepID=UPI0039E252BE